MADSTSKLIRLDANFNTNWDVNAAPVAVLNEASTLHDRVAYCWGLADQIQDLVLFLMQHSDFELARAGNLVYCHVSPLVAVLEQLADDTVPGRA